MAIKDIRKQLQLLSALTSINHSIGANLELEDVTRIIVRELVNILNCEGCAIILVDGDKLNVPAEKNLNKTLMGQELSINSPVIRDVIKNGKNSQLSGLNHLPATTLTNEMLGRSPLYAPIIIRGEVKGIIYLSKEIFKEEDVYFAELLAKEIAIALERSLVYSQVKILGIKDGLTGCYNRRKFDEDLDNELARAIRYGKPLSLIMMDLDWFKEYNDFHGHTMGDTLLKGVVRLLMGNVRPFDKIYRYGGEEFAILLPETEKERALAVANRLLDLLRQEPFEGEEKSQPRGQVTASMGVAGFPSNEHTRDALLKAADTALYRAKADGRDRAIIYS